MINQELLHPRSIVVIGGSNNVHKPGGAIVRNIKDGGFEGELHIVNPKEEEVQGIKVFHDVKDIPQTDLAILVVAARFCPDYVDFLCAEKGVRAFVIISAGFGEETWRRFHQWLWCYSRVYPGECCHQGTAVQ